MVRSMIRTTMVLLALGSSALAAMPGYTETFDGGTAGWSAFADDVSVAAAYMGAPDTAVWVGFYDTGWLYADGGASGGAFVGDYAAAGATGLEAVVAVDYPEDIDYVSLYFHSTYDDAFYYADFTLGDDGWFTLSADFADAWYNSSLDDYAAPSLAALQQVDEAGVVATAFLGIEFETYVNVDSFTLVPEPATLSLLGLGGLALIRRRR